MAVTSSFIRLTRLPDQSLRANDHGQKNLGQKNGGGVENAYLFAIDVFALRSPGLRRETPRMNVARRKPRIIADSHRAFSGSLRYHPGMAEKENRRRMPWWGSAL